MARLYEPQYVGVSGYEYYRNSWGVTGCSIMIPWSSHKIWSLHEFRLDILNQLLQDDLTHRHRMSLLNDILFNSSYRHD